MGGTRRVASSSACCVRTNWNKRKKNNFFGRLGGRAKRATESKEKDPDRSSNIYSNK
jgi:hypothetical protein